jgi:hypothetical protein
MRPFEWFADAIRPLEIRDLPASAPLILAAQSNAPKGVIQAADTNFDGASPFTKYSSFRATFSGQFFEGPGRSADQKSQGFLSGAGNSSMFLHGDFQMATVRYEDPAKPSQAIALLIPKNITNSGNQLSVEMEAVPGSVDRFGRPTLWTWTVDSGSGGTFDGAVGSGTAQVIYMNKRIRNGWPSGNFNILFKGNVGTTGIGNLLRKISSAP